MEVGLRLPPLWGKCAIWRTLYGADTGPRAATGGFYGNNAVAVYDPAWLPKPLFLPLSETQPRAHPPLDRSAGD